MPFNHETSRRLQLHQKLISIMGTENEQESRVYFQPPASLRMTYPAIVYYKDGRWTNHADNFAYFGKQRYAITVIDPDPDSDIAVRIESAFPLCEVDRSFVSDNLYHVAVTLYW